METTLDNNILKHLETSHVKIGNHSVTFVDTTEAWQMLMTSFSRPKLSDSRKNECESSMILETNLNGDANNGTTTSAEDMNNYDILPEYARYNYTYTPQRDRCCYFCRKTTEFTDAAVRLTCRICDRQFHEECVRKRGYCDDEVSENAIIECKTSTVGWSCPRCEDVYNLLLEEEKEEISELFDTVSGNPSYCVSVLIHGGGRGGYCFAQKFDVFKLVVLAIVSKFLSN